MITWKKSPIKKSGEKEAIHEKAWIQHSTDNQNDNFDALQAQKSDPRETPPIRPLESDADVSIHVLPYTSQL